MISELESLLPLFELQTPLSGVCLTGPVSPCYSTAPRPKYVDLLERINMITYMTFPGRISIIGALTGFPPELARIVSIMAITPIHHDLIEDIGACSANRLLFRPSEVQDVAFFAHPAPEDEEHPIIRQRRAGARAFRELCRVGHHRVLPKIIDILDATCGDIRQYTDHIVLDAINNARDGGHLKVLKPLIARFAGEEFCINVRGDRSGGAVSMSRIVMQLHECSTNRRDVLARAALVDLSVVKCVVRLYSITPKDIELVYRHLNAIDLPLARHGRPLPSVMEWLRGQQREQLRERLHERLCARQRA